MALALGALLLVAAPGAAAPLPEADLESLGARVADFDAAFRANDLAVVLGMMPPRILDTFAADADASREEMLEAMVEATEQALAAVEIKDFAIDVAVAETGALDDGTGWAKIPTTTEMTVNRGVTTLRFVSTTFALQDTGTWYLLRVDTPEHVEMLGRSYPAFADMTFVPGKMTVEE